MGDFHSFPIICSINKTCVVSYANVARHSALPSVGLDGFSGDWKEELFFGSSWDGWRILQLTAPDVTFPVEYFFHSCLLAESPFLWHKNLNLQWCDFIVEIDSIDSQSSKKFPPIDSFRFLGLFLNSTKDTFIIKTICKVDTKRNKVSFTILLWDTNKKHV